STRWPIARGPEQKRIDNHRPSCIDAFHNEDYIFDGTVHKKTLRHVRFVWVQVNEPPRRKNRCGKQDGEFSSAVLGIHAVWNRRGYRGELDSNLCSRFGKIV